MDSDFTSHERLADETLATRIRAAKFTPVRLRDGYRQRDVDDFLDQLVTDLESPSPQLGTASIEAARFTVVRMEEGYAKDEVDALLDQAATHLTLHGRRDGLREQQPVSTPARERSSRARSQWLTLMLIAALLVGMLVSALAR
ncbi:DivIVA domain-containing protein [Nocardioides ochotonae]|uniref:DivIVA domain-containing protein n=1 Tax=Nocardioides ochotonae TaxID=2685869 RepID=UPI0014074881|nr:DivIVA domain-containing protein [Nocardioides ochotonae]